MLIAASEEPKTVIERVCEAWGSHDLTLREVRSDVDYLIGLAAAAQRVNRGAEAVMKLRMALDVSAWPVALERAKQIAHRLACRERWHLEDAQVNALARATLKHYVVPVCPECSGRKYVEITGTRRLGNRACPCCHGTGERPLPRNEARRMRAIMAELDRDASNLEVALRAVMR